MWCRKLRELRNMEGRRSMKRPFRMSSRQVATSVWVVRRSPCRTTQTYDLLADASRAGHLNDTVSRGQEQKMSTVGRVHCDAPGKGRAPSSRPRVPSEDLCCCAICLRQEVLTFLSHFAFAFAQCTHAIGIRSVGESILRVEGGVYRYVDQRPSAQRRFRPPKLPMRDSIWRLVIGSRPSIS